MTETDWTYPNDYDWGIRLSIKLELLLPHELWMKDQIPKALEKACPWLGCRTSNDKDSRLATIITRPLPWIWVMENLKDFEPIFDLKTQLGCETKAPHEMIIWASRRKLEHIQQGRLNYFLNRYESKALIHKITESGYQRRAILDEKYVFIFPTMRATLEKDKFLKNIEFCKALEEYADDTFINEMNSDSFTEWVLEHSIVFPYLAEWLRPLALIG